MINENFFTPITSFVATFTVTPVGASCNAQVVLQGSVVARVLSPRAKEATENDKAAAASSVFHSWFYFTR